jgi:general secretion pathway protein G
MTRSLRAKWNGPYLQSIPKDPWGYNYHYKSPGANHADFDLWTNGADGKPGGEGEGEDADVYWGGD